MAPAAAVGVPALLDDDPDARGGPDLPAVWPPRGFVTAKATELAQVRGVLAGKVVVSRSNGHSAGTHAPEVGESTQPLAPPVDEQTTAVRRPRRRFVPVANITPRLLTLAEAASYVRLSPWTLRELAWKGTLRPVRITRALRFDRADLDRLIEASK